jgi:hypothetical protein
MHNQNFENSLNIKQPSAKQELQHKKIMMVLSSNNFISDYRWKRMINAWNWKWPEVQHFPLMMIKQKWVKKKLRVILNKVLRLVVNTKDNFTLIKMEAKRCICNYIAELINDFYG